MSDESFCRASVNPSIDTGLYYLQSRYYDPATGRFLNADIVFDYDAGFPGYNLFVYCGNEPILRIDCSGADSNKMDDGELTDDEMDSWGSGGGGPLRGGSGISTLTSPSGSTKKMLLELFDLLTQTFRDGFNGMNGVFRSTFSSSGLFLPEDYYTGKEAPKYYTPCSEYSNWKYCAHTGEYEYSTAYYDYGGRQVLRIDWTNHGRADHTSPHAHLYLYDGTYPMGVDVRKLG